MAMTSHDIGPWVNPELGEDRWWDWQHLAWQQTNLKKLDLPTNVNDIPKAKRKEFNRNRIDYNRVLPFHKTAQFKAARRNFVSVASTASNTSTEAFGISGPAYGGKTSILRHLLFEYFASQHGEPPEDYACVPDGKSTIPVIWGQAAGTSKQTLQRLLKFLNVPNASGSAEDMSERLADATMKFGIKFIVLDDLHRLNETLRKDHAANELKTMMESAKRTTFLFTTTDRNTCAALNGPGHEQITRRITWLDHRPVKRNSDQWKAALAHWEDHMPLCYDRKGGPMLEPLSSYLYDRTGGHLGHLATLLRRGAAHAIQSPKITDERLTTDILNTVPLAFESAGLRRAS